jgi:hypothetical protein
VFYSVAGLIRVGYWKTERSKETNEQKRDQEAKKQTKKARKKNEMKRNIKDGRIKKKIQEIRRCIIQLNTDLCRPTRGCQCNRAFITFSSMLSFYSEDGGF